MEYPLIADENMAPEDMRWLTLCLGATGLLLTAVVLIAVNAMPLVPGTTGALLVYMGASVIVGILGLCALIYYGAATVVYRQYRQAKRVN